MAVCPRGSSERPEIVATDQEEAARRAKLVKGTSPIWQGQPAMFDLPFLAQPSVSATAVSPSANAVS